MKLSDDRPSVESSGELEEQFFSIQDQGMIFDILRNKMYSNPIRAICREISCNARDAHREIGKADVPIEITLPNALEPFYKIRDFGPGISPDRMSNIFIKYTASTKRGDNVQTGGFGLGAKTPFSYSDTFTIKTVYDGIEYSYACVIDETKVGKLMTLDQTPTKNPNGTEIIIPIKPSDFRNFVESTEYCCRHWEVLPTIKGGTIAWKSNSKIITGTGWAISASNDYNRTVNLIIDGIEYPVDLTVLRTYADSKLIDAARGNLLLYFGVGELSLSASREAVYLDKPTKAKISAKIDMAVKEVKKNVEDKIAALPNLWEANVYYRHELVQGFNNIQFLGKLEWQGIELHNNYQNLDCTIYQFNKGGYSRKTGHDPNKIKRSIMSQLNYINETALYINDLPLKEPTPKHVKKAFENNPKLTSVQLVCPNDKTTVDVLNKKYHFDKMQAIKLSTIATATSRNYTAATSRLLVFKHDLAAAAFRQISYTNIDDDKNDKVLCMLVRGGDQNRYAKLGNGKSMDSYVFRGLQLSFPDVSFYGVDVGTDAARIKEDLSDFVSLDEFLKENVTNNKKINFVEIKYAATQSYNVDGRLLGSSQKILPLIQDKNSLFLKKVELHNKISKMIQTNDQIVKLYELINGDISKKEQDDFEKNNPDWNLKKFDKKIEDKYPLLNAISTYNYDQLVPAIAQYINLVDKV